MTYSCILYSSAVISLFDKPITSNMYSVHVHSLILLLNINLIYLHLNQSMKCTCKITQVLRFGSVVLRFGRIPIYMKLCSCTCTLCEHPFMGSTRLNLIWSIVVINNNFILPFADVSQKHGIKIYQQHQLSSAFIMKGGQHCYGQL